jgi:ribonuclease Y
MLEIILAAVISGAVCLGGGILAGITIRKRTAEREIGSAEEQARKILEDGIKTAESRKKEALIEAKEEIIRTKNEFERELANRRNELSRQERRVASKEETLDKKTEALEKKDEALTKKLKETTELNEEIERLKAQQFEVLQKTAGLTAEEAIERLIAQLEVEIRHEQAKKIVELEEQFRADAMALAFMASIPSFRTIVNAASTMSSLDTFTFGGMIDNISFVIYQLLYFERQYYIWMNSEF